MKFYYQSVIFLVLLGLFNACQSHYYKESQLIPNTQWDKNSVIVFTANIEDISAPFNVILDFSYHAQIPHTDLIANVEMTSPSGTTETQTYSVPIKTEAGEHLGDVAGDYGDITLLMKENTTFAETGTYTFKISQAMPPQSVGGISRVGIIIDQIKE